MKEEELRRLIQLMEKNDGRAFEDFFNLLYPRFFRYAFLYLKSDVLCEELVSDVFVKLWNVRHKLNKVKQLEFYLFRAVKNQVLTYIKRNAKHSIGIAEYHQSDLVEYNSPENLLIASELAEKIEEIISNLPDRCETIFRMVREDGLSYKQVAVLLDISSKTVENQMNTALKKIRKAIEAYFAKENIDSKGMIFSVFHLF